MEWLFSLSWSESQLKEIRLNAAILLNKCLYSIFVPCPTEVEWLTMIGISKGQYISVWGLSLYRKSSYFFILKLITNEKLVKRALTDKTLD